MTFIVQGQEVYASKMVLPAANDYFKAMLLGEAFKEKTSAEPSEIHDVYQATFVACLRYLYTGQIDLTSKNVEPVVRAADMFLMETLLGTCQ